MRQKVEVTKPSEKLIKDIRRVTRKQYGAEEKIRTVLEVLPGEELVAALGRREGIVESPYYTGRRNSSKPARRGCDVILRVLPPPMRSRYFDVKCAI